MLMALLGFLAPFLPDLIGLGKNWSDHSQEMQMMRLRHDMAKEESNWRLDEVQMQARVAENLAVRKPHESYGVQLLDRASSENSFVWRWSFNLVFLAFCMLDWLISFVRPSITYLAFGFYMAVKAATFYTVYQMVQAAGFDGMDAASKALLNEGVFTDFDLEIFMLIVTFWFGTRAKNNAGRANKDK